MSTIRNVIVSQYIADGLTSKFMSAGLTTLDAAYNIVVINGRQVPTSKYTILPDFAIQLVDIPANRSKVSIHAFEKANSTLDIYSNDNVTTISHTSYVCDGLTSSFPAPTPARSRNIHYIVTMGGFITTQVADYDIVANSIVFGSALFKGVILDITVFYNTPPDMSIIGGISPAGEITQVQREEITASGTTDTYTLPTLTLNKSVYSLIFINGIKCEAGVEYISSHGRIKFNRVIPAGAIISFIIFNRAAPALVPKSPTTRVRYLDKDANLNERTLYKNYWREQISQYGMIVNYYTSLTTVENADIIYGESPLAGYSEPEELNIAIQIDSEDTMFSKFGLMADTEATCIIHHEDFQDIFGPQSEPKAGDLIEFTEVGIDRLNFPNRGPRIMEITQRSDEIPGVTNNLAGHYVWQIKLKRFDYSKEFSMLPELGTKDPSNDGQTIEGLPNSIEEMSKKIFDYTVNPCSNDNVYGDY